MTNPALKPAELEFWTAYCRKGGVPEASPVYAGMPGNEQIADELLAHYLSGRKTAGSGLVRDYERAGDPLPRAGNHWIVLSSAGEPGCIVRTLRVERCRFSEVPEAVAIAEGEGDLSLAYWRQAHERFFAPFLASLGIQNLQDAEIVTEYFEVVFRR